MRRTPEHREDERDEDEPDAQILALDERCEPAISSTLRAFRRSRDLVPERRRDARLIGTKGRARDALALGGIVTVTHTIGVFALGIATLALSEFRPREVAGAPARS